MKNVFTVVSACLAGITAAANINYGDQMFFQNNWRDNRWLSGARNRGNTQVVTRNHLGSNYERERVARTYKWTIRSTAGNGARSYPDPKAGDCLRYGDIIYLQNNWINNRWLTVSRVNSRAFTRNYLGTHSGMYRWIVRSTPGSGALAQLFINRDPQMRLKIH